MADFAVARQNMVAGQLRPNRVNDPALLAAVGELPRELFLPPPLRGIAYVDDDIPLGNGRFLMEPVVLCRMLQAAEPKASDVALDIGCGTGYATALLSRLVTTVFGIESDPDLVHQATNNLAAISVDNAVVVQQPLEQGCPEHAPYDVIVISGAVEWVPDAITAQLAEGGRLVAVVGDGRGMGTARLMQKVGGTVSSRPLFDAGTPVLPGFHRPSKFVF